MIKPVSHSIAGSLSFRAARVRWSSPKRPSEARSSPGRTTAVPLVSPLQLPSLEDLSGVGSQHVGEHVEILRPILCHVTACLWTVGTPWALPGQVQQDVRSRLKSNGRPHLIDFTCLPAFSTPAL